MLERSRDGDLSAPFDRSGLAAENQRALVGFIDDPIGLLRSAAERFCQVADDSLEIMPHQFGPIPVGLQAVFGLNELVIHHDDLLAAAGRSYQPQAGVIDVLAEVWAGPLGAPVVLASDDRWVAVLRASGR